MITLQLNEGLQNALDGKLYPNIATNHKRKIFGQFIEDIKKLFNYQLLGEENSPTQWSCPHDPVAQELTEITLDNNCT